MSSIWKIIGFTVFLILQGRFFFYTGQKRTKEWSSMQTEEEKKAVRKPSNSTLARTTYKITKGNPSNSSIKQRTKDTTTVWEPFNTTNPHLNWCPFAICQNSPMCTPCQRRFLLIIATGRSGSTSLLRMMNALPGIRLSGENNNELGFEKKALDNLLNVENFRPNNNNYDAWRHNEIPGGSLSCPIQKMFEAINPPKKQIMESKDFDDSNKIIGFKTVRFHLNDSLKESVQFVKDSFPCVRVLVNIRSDIEGQSKSRTKWFKNKSNPVDIELENAKMKSVAEMFGSDHAILLDMSNWTKKRNWVR